MPHPETEELTLPSGDVYGGFRVRSGRTVQVTEQVEDDARPEQTEAFRDDLFHQHDPMDPAYAEPDFSQGASSEGWEDPEMDPMPGAMEGDGPPISNWLDFGKPPTEKPELSAFDDARPEQTEAFRDDLFEEYEQLDPSYSEPDFGQGASSEGWEDPEMDPMPEAMEGDGPPISNWLDLGKPPTEKPELSAFDDARPEQTEAFRDDLFEEYQQLDPSYSEPDFGQGASSEGWEDPEMDPMPGAAQGDGPPISNWLDFGKPPTEKPELSAFDDARPEQAEAFRDDLHQAHEPLDTTYAEPDFSQGPSSEGWQDPEMEKPPGATDGPPITNWTDAGAPQQAQQARPF